MRPDGRAPSQLRPVSIEVDYLRYAEGSALIRTGETWVLCAATVEEKVPSWMDPRQGLGWVTAEYAMLPRSTHTRTSRSQGGREKEIQRLVGRALRAAFDRARLGPRTLIVDCDVLQADGGTRTAAITGGFVACALAIDKLRKKGVVKADPCQTEVAAVSVGMIDGEPRLDLAYEEDSRAEVDLNVVMTSAGHFVELQGTAEGVPFSDAQLGSMLELARAGIRELIAAQRQALGRAPRDSRG